MSNPSPTPRLDALIKSLPGRPVEVGYASMAYQHRGFRFLVEEAELDPVEKRFAIKPVNNGPIVMMPFREVALLTNDRIVITGGVEGSETEWSFRLEARDLLDG